MRPSESTGRLYEKLDNTPLPASKEAHKFTVKLEDWDTETDEIEMDPHDFPYLRSTLISVACYEGDIQQ